jgi:hypothetical protein
MPPSVRFELDRGTVDRNSGSEQTYPHCTKPQYNKVMPKYNTIFKKPQTDLFVALGQRFFAQIHGLDRSHIKSRTQDRLTGTTLEL